MFHAPPPEEEQPRTLTASASGEGGGGRLGLAAPEASEAARLPAEVWEEVLGWVESVNDLCACALTCRDWATLAWRSRRRIALHCSSAQRDMSGWDAALGVVGRRTQGKLERLDLVGPKVCVSANAMSGFLDESPRLSDLRLHRCHVALMHVDVIQALVDHASDVASRLRVLVLCGMRRLTDYEIGTCFGKFKALQSLSLEACTQITSKGLSSLAARCPQLAALCLKGCYRLKDDGVIEVIRKCQGLQKLNVQGLNAISDATLHALAQNHPTTLRSLNVWSCNITDEALGVLLQNCINVEKLVLKFCTGVTQSSTFQNLTYSERLRYLDIQGLSVDDRALEYIADNLAATLNVLDVRDCPNISPRGLIHVISRCTNLTVLRMRSAAVNDECVVAAARHLGRLRTLDLQKCMNVTALGVRALASGGESSQGAILDNTDDRTLATASTKSACYDSLRILNVLGLPLIAKADVAWVLAKLPRLEARTDFDVRPYVQDLSSVITKE